MRCLLLACFVLLLCGVIAKKDSKLKIAVYYESLCPDSKQFIKTQLAPVWNMFRGSIKVKLVPYGKSTHEQREGKWHFTCHHGPDECYGNKVQACVLKDKALQDTEKMDIIVCLMSQAYPDKALETCLNENKKASELTKLTQCASGQQGENLLASYGDKTGSFQRPLSFVPTVVINENYSPAIQDEAIKDLKAVVCRVAEVKPSNC